MVLVGEVVGKEMVWSQHVSSRFQNGSKERSRFVREVARLASSKTHGYGKETIVVSEVVCLKKIMDLHMVSIVIHGHIISWSF